jgi:hypothetical protein
MKKLTARSQSVAAFLITWGVVFLVRYFVSH